MDPNRYSKNQDIRPDSAWQIAQALLTMGLILCGMIGLAVHLFGGNFSPTEWLAWLIASPLNMILAAILLLAAFFFHRYISHISNQQRRSASDLPVYLMMLIGAYFIYQLVTTGHW